MTDEKITDEMLKQRWMEWECEEELVDKIIKRFKDMEIPEISFGSFYGYTYDNESEFQSAVGIWEPSYKKLSEYPITHTDSDNEDTRHDVIEEVEIGLGTSTGRHQYQFRQIIKKAIDSCRK